jgi:hypothetical protein
MFVKDSTEIASGMKDGIEDALSELTTPVPRESRESKGLTSFGDFTERSHMYATEEEIWDGPDNGLIRGLQSIAEVLLEQATLP